MPQQLVYTSSPQGLVPGRSGYCTVARSAGMREALMLCLEQISYYNHRALTGGIDRPIFSYRILDIRGSRFHVLSRILDAGLDFTGRTNFLAHHLVVAPGEIQKLATPAALLRGWSGWLASWSSEPRELSNEDWGNLDSLARGRALPARTWERLTGDPANGYALLEIKTGGVLWAPQASEGDLLSLAAETMELLELRDPRRDFRAAAWQYTLTTSLQEQDNPGDFRWRFVHRDNPAFAKLAVGGCVAVAGLCPSHTTAEERNFAKEGWRAPSRIEVQVDRAAITEGETITLEAVADGCPAPSFRWFEIRHDQPMEIEGIKGPTLERQPQGRASRYAVQAINRAGSADSDVVEITIHQPVRLSRAEPLLVQPKDSGIGRPHTRTPEQIEAQRSKIQAEQEKRLASRSRRVSALAAVATVVGVAAFLSFCRVWEKPNVSMDPANVDFGAATNGAPPVMTVDLTNRGHRKVCGTASLGEPFRIKGNPGFSLAPGEAARLEISFDPTDSLSVTQDLRLSCTNHFVGSLFQSVCEYTSKVRGHGLPSGPAAPPSAPATTGRPPERTGAPAPAPVQQGGGLGASSSSKSKRSETMADPLPSFEPWPTNLWKEARVGNIPEPLCRKGLSNTTFSITGPGRIGDGAQDSCYFVHQAVSNVVEISALLTEVEHESNQSLCGLMVRESAAADAPFAFIGKSSAMVFSYCRRARGVNCQRSQDPSMGTQPMRLRIREAQGFLLTEYSTNNGLHWKALQPAGGFARSFTKQSGGLTAGMAVSSGIPTGAVTARFVTVGLKFANRPL